ncbi:MAG TPA: ABC transporter substrate-binding protein [Verrucomicrobiales bacterium]|nr:ABC transporter substrate-binding protein [Verrucomicrobiales bacterium]
MLRALIVLAAMAGVLALPFAFRESGETAPRDSSHTADVLTIITPHNETIRAEFAFAFRKHMERSAGRRVQVEWRTLGGTSEIEHFLDTSFTYAFRRYWIEDLQRSWDDLRAGERFDDPRLTLPSDPAGDDLSQQARRAFLTSNVGVGIDLFFGGGPYPFILHGAKGHLVDPGIFESHPDWFSDAVIPSSYSGEPFYDPEKRWIGACLSTFGICSNSDSLDRLGLDFSDPRWSDLADPRLFGQVALADPTKSGSAAKAFEMVIQEQMRLAIEAARKENGTAPLASGREQEAVAAGWDDALRLLQRIAGNARYFSNIAPRIPLDVAQGDAAAGMCIDFFGRTYNERLRDDNGVSRVQYVTPANGSSTTVDPIAMLRGAPNPELARSFIEFVLSPGGQRLWNYRPGLPGGPQHIALRRLPIRRDLYTPNELRWFSDPDELPFDRGIDFTYEPSWTASVFSPIRFVLKCACLDAHDELRQAWQALIRHGFPPEATQTFHDLSPVSYSEATGPIAATLRSGDPVAELRLARRLTQHFRQRYREAASLARANR